MHGQDQLASVNKCDHMGGRLLLSTLVIARADAVHKVHPGKMLAYNCSPSFNWKKNLNDATIAKFQCDRGYTFVSHQQKVGTGYFDEVTTTIQGGKSSVTALTGSTEEEQFH
jgi:isocitrate lyase